MNASRPDLSKVDPGVRAYIEALEAEIERLSRRSNRSRSKPEIEEEFDEIQDIHEPAEPPTTYNVITATASGIAKRTPRHLYSRQRRGGMGVFDLDAPGDSPPAILAIADERQNLLLITNFGRAFRLPVNQIPETELRARGETIVNKLNLMPDEGLAVFPPDQAQGYVALLSRRGNVRLLRHHVFGEHMKPGTALYDVKAFGPLASACWTPGDGDLFIATSQGRAIRFSEKLIPPQGGIGIRLGDGDHAVGIAPVYADSRVFLLGADGKGTIRLMEGFSPNKAPGAGGKIAMATDRLIGSLNVDEAEDIFIISKLGKIIRFNAGEVPAKDGVVQGVICMSLRGDEPMAMTISQTIRAF